MYKINYVPLNIIAERDNISISRLKNLYANNSHSNDIRFKKINGELLIALNYENPLFDIVSSRYIDAMQLAPNQTSLAFQLSNISGIKQDTIAKGLNRFSFSQYQVAIRYLIMFDRYIELQKKIESLYLQALDYDDLEKLTSILSSKFDITITKSKKSLLNETHKINLYHLQTMLEEFLYQKKIKQIITKDN